MHVCVCGDCTLEYNDHRSEEDNRSPEAGVAGDFESPKVGAEDRTQVLCKEIPALNHGAISPGRKIFLTAVLSSGINWLTWFSPLLYHHTFTNSPADPDTVQKALKVYLAAERIWNNKRLTVSE